MMAITNHAGTPLAKVPDGIMVYVVVRLVIILEMTNVISSILKVCMVGPGRQLRLSTI